MKSSPTNPIKDIDDRIELVLQLFQRDLERKYGGRTVSETLTGDQASKAIKKIISEEVVKAEKAFGNCKKCYGKGYATYFGTYSVRQYKWKDPEDMKFCTCERGEQLEERIIKLRAEG